jgi:acetoacetyl-CoA synthetase
MSLSNNEFVSPLWVPSDQRRHESHLAEFLSRHGFESYDEAWRWSVDTATIGDFWRDVADEAHVTWHSEPRTSIEVDVHAMTGVRWFPGGTLNYAELALRRNDDGDAIIAYDDARGRRVVSWRELRVLVGRLQAGLIDRGVGPGDVVAAYLPNVPETLALMLATVALGAVWTCCAPETGPVGALDRLVQTEPTVFVATNGYRYGDKVVDSRENAREILAGLANVRHAVALEILDVGTPGEDWETWEDFQGEDRRVTFQPVAFEHPLYILYSSGTTGKPKAIVHGHGGITLEHAKALHYHFDLDEKDRFFWYSTTGWMMWNFCVSGLLVGATVVLYDGDPNWPSPDRLWAVMADEHVTCAGVGAAFLVACRKAGLNPRERFDLSRLATLGSTGSPLPPDAARWVYESVANDVLLASFSGGTDVCTGFVGSSPLHDVWAGEISCRCLGAKVEAFDAQGHSLVDVEGEMVVTAPMPSMPVRLLNDPGDARYRETYFPRSPGVWDQGDRITITSRGTVVITGRSDGTLNRGGVRMGTAEFYSAVETLDAVVDSLVVHLEDPEGGPGELWLFVVAPEADPIALEGELRSLVRTRLSPRHLPDYVVVVEAVPRTLTGKKLEVPVKKILAGANPEDVVTVSSLANPESLETYVALARGRIVRP